MALIYFVGSKIVSRLVLLVFVQVLFIQLFTPVWGTFLSHNPRYYEVRPNLFSRSVVDFSQQNEPQPVSAIAKASTNLGDNRPPPNQRKFRSQVIDDQIANITKKMKDPYLAFLFTNCFPNTLDTTIDYTEDTVNGIYDTFV